MIEIRGYTVAQVIKVTGLKHGAALRRLHKYGKCHIDHVQLFAPANVTKPRTRK